MQGKVLNQQASKQAKEKAEKEKRILHTKLVVLYFQLIKRINNPIC